VIFAITVQAVTTRHQPANIDSKEKLEAAPQQRRLLPKVSFASLKKQAEALFPLICCERKTLLRLKKQAEKYGL